MLYKTSNPVLNLVFLCLSLFSAPGTLYALQQVLAEADTSAQAMGIVSGQVIDLNTQQPLIGVSVAVVGTKRGALSKKDGRFVITKVPAGVFSIKATLIGYAPDVKSDVVVSSGKPTTIEIRLSSQEVQLGETVVISEAFRTDGQSISSTQLLTSEEVRRAPGVQEDVVRAIALLPGVAVTQAGRNDLAIRGGAPFENLFLIDNIEVPNINHFGSQGSSGGPLSLINIALVRDVSLSTGGFGPRYGDRLSSVTNLTLREGNDQRFAGELNVSATGVGLIAEGPIGERGSYLFSARRSYLDLIFTLAGFGFIPEYWDFSSKVTYELSSTDKLSFLAIGALDKLKFNNTQDNLYNNSRVTAPSQNQYFAGLTWRHLLGNGYMNVTLGRTFTYYNTVQQDSLANDIFKTVTTEGENSLRADVVTFPTSSMELNVGAIVKYASTLDYKVVLPGFARLDATGTPAPLNVDTSFSALRGGVYAQADWAATDRIKITLGARGDYYAFLENNKVALSPRATLSYLLSPEMTLRLSAGRYYQSPQYIWLVGDASNRANLRPIRADQAILGWEWIATPDVKIQVEAYYKSYDAYPTRTFRPQAVLAPAGFDDIYTDIPFGLEPLTNSGTGTAYGIEFFIQKKLSASVPIYGLASISINRTQFVALDGQTRVGSFDTPIISTIAVGWRPDAEWEVSSKLRMSQGLPSTPYITTGSRAQETGFPVGSLDFDFFNQGARLPFFYALDARLDRRWFFTGWQLIVYVDVQNITGRKNVSGYKWNQQTQSVEAQASIGVLPSIGINIQF
ncbi:MAG: TonB-dependent receptor [Candidatus Kapabacteria bacterium]|nr:TonB-dependent receptor [Candidatus Kapabacteria bacterium]